MIDASEDLLLQCLTDNALYQLRAATVLARRLGRNANIQHEMAELQEKIKTEFSSREMADGPRD